MHYGHRCDSDARILNTPRFIFTAGLELRSATDGKSLRISLPIWGHVPTSKHEIDRYPNPYGNYEPGNTRWATRRENMRNLRTNRLITIDGVTHCLVEWMELSG